ncbi:hypothetical protein TNCV_4709291 [Trichonephila clavipes]|nr:hypothetical protein TNCV_4709291 [Trichonephila clavipes]
MDEVQLTFDCPPNRTVDTCGVKTVSITTGQDPFHSDARLLRRGTRKKEKRGGDPKGEVGEKSSEKRRADRLRKRRGESQSFLLGDADQESETRMSKNALRTGRRQAVE